MDSHQARQDAEAPDPDGTTRPLLRQQQELHMGQPVADPAGAAAEPERRRHRRSGVSWLTILGISFLTFNSGMAIYRCQGERGATVFVVVSYVDLLLLFFALRWYETAEPGSLTRDRLKVVVWVLTTALTLLFTSKVAAVMPALVAVLVWVLAFTTIAGGFYGFFCYSNKE